MLGATMAFGGPLAAFHALLFSRTTRAARKLVPIAFVTLALAVPAGRYLRDQLLNEHARAQFSATCREDYAVVAMRPDLLDAARADLQLAAGERRHRLAIERGDWHESSEYGGAVTRGATLTVDGLRTLALTDIALAPITPASRFGFARSVQRQCLTRFPGADAELARRLGMVEPLAPGTLRPLPLL
ncbi:MAG TPA: hypothetical protein VI168_16845 [Croceibacterium sp.]